MHSGFDAAVYPANFDDEVYFISDDPEVGKIVGIGKIINISQFYITVSPVDDRAKALFADDEWLNKYPEPKMNRPEDGVASSMWRMAGLAFHKFNGVGMKGPFMDEKENRSKGTRIVGKWQADHGILSLSYNVQPPTLEALISNGQTRVHQRALQACDRIRSAVGLPSQQIGVEHRPFPPRL